MTNKQIALGILGATALIGAILWWTAERDGEVRLAAERYEACVAHEYHSTPSAWLAATGEYPYCEN